MTLNNFYFDTKANNLNFLRQYLKSGKICSSYIFTTFQWINNQELISLQNFLNIVTNYRWKHIIQAGVKKTLIQDISINF